MHRGCRSPVYADTQGFVFCCSDDGRYTIRIQDPLGIKPMCIGKTSQDRGGIGECGDRCSWWTFLRDLKPGEPVCIDEDGMRAMQIAVSDCRAHCIFEYIYFARADSILDGALVYDVRRNIGGKLHEEASRQCRFNMPGPGFRTAYAIGYSKTSHIPFVESLMKNSTWEGPLSCPRRLSGRRRSG